MSRYAIDRSFCTLPPGLIEIDAIDVLKDVNASRRLSDLKHRVGVIAKIGWS